MPPRSSRVNERQFGQGVNRKSPVWLSSRRISTTRTRRKLDHQWRGPFSIFQQISKYAYKLTLPPSMKGVHTKTGTKHVKIERKEKCEVEDILNGQKQNNHLKYLTSCEGFATKHNSWEAENNLGNCSNMLIYFDSKFPEVM